MDRSTNTNIDAPLKFNSFHYPRWMDRWRLLFRRMRWRLYSYSIAVLARFDLSKSPMFKFDVTSAPALFHMRRDVEAICLEYHASFQVDSRSWWRVVVGQMSLCHGEASALCRPRSLRSCRLSLTVYSHKPTNLIYIVIFYSKRTSSDFTSCVPHWTSRVGEILIPNQRMANYVFLLFITIIKAGI